MRIGSNSGFSKSKENIIRQTRAKSRAKYRTSDNTLKSALSKRLSSKSSSLTTDVTKKNFNAIKEAADRLQAHAGKLTATGENSLFASAIKEKDGTTPSTAEKDKVIGEINSFIEDYNTMISKMSETDETINNLYLRQVNNYASEYKAELKTLGITMKSDGTLSASQNTLKSADLEKLQKVFGAKGGFAEKVAIKSKEAESNAGINLTSLNNSYHSNYNRYGHLDSSSAGSGSLYNSRG